MAVVNGSESTQGRAGVVPRGLEVLKIRTSKILQKHNFFIFVFSQFLTPVGGVRGEGPKKSSPPCDSLHFGSGKLHFDKML